MSAINLYGIKAGNEYQWEWLYVALRSQNRSAGIADVPRSRILGRVGATNLKVLRMDAHSVAEEVHVYDEGLLVIDGRLELSVQEKKSPSRPASFI